jgi:hypothetical protein
MIMLHEVAKIVTDSWIENLEMKEIPEYEHSITGRTSPTALCVLGTSEARNVQRHDISGHALRRG